MKPCLWGPVFSRRRVTNDSRPCARRNTQEHHRSGVQKPSGGENLKKRARVYGNPPASKKPLPSDEEDDTTPLSQYHKQQKSKAVKVVAEAKPGASAAEAARAAEAERAAADRAAAVEKATAEIVKEATEAVVAQEAKVVAEANGCSIGPCCTMAQIDLRLPGTGLPGHVRVRERHLAQPGWGWCGRGSRLWPLPAFWPPLHASPYWPRTWGATCFRSGFFRRNQLSPPLPLFPPCACATLTLA